MNARHLSWIAALIAPTLASASTYQVGPTRAYASLPALFSAVTLHAGDLVEVDGNVTYAGGIIVRDSGASGNPITFRGVRVNGQRPHLSGGTNTIEFRLSDHVVFEGFEVTGSGTGTFRCIYHHSDDLTLRDVLVHACPQHGIQSADQDSGSLTLEYSEVYDAGAGTSQHALYIASDEVNHPGSVFRAQYNYLHDSNGGNLIKSRAERNEIYYNWLEGAFYHELELIGPDPNGVADGWTEDLKREDSDVVGNVILHTSAFGSIIRAGGDGTGQTNGRYRFVNNTIVRTGGANDVPTVFRLFDGIDSIEMHNNVIWREGANAVRVTREVEAVWVSGQSRIAGSNNWIETGSTFVPPNWTATTIAADPGFADAATLDFRPTTAALIDAGTTTTSTPPNYNIANALFPPTHEPPPHIVPAIGAAPLRPINGPIDIGAFEHVGDSIFVNGFDTTP